MHFFWKNIPSNFCPDCSITNAEALPEEADKQQRKNQGWSLIRHLSFSIGKKI
jgi:hypothetical protein